MEGTTVVDYGVAPTVRDVACQVKEVRLPSKSKYNMRLSVSDFEPHLGDVGKDVRQVEKILELIEKDAQEAVVCLEQLPDF